MRTFVLLVVLGAVVSAAAGCVVKKDLETSAAGDSCQDALRTADFVDANHTKVKFTTTKGNFTAELLDDRSPITVANFKAYVSDGFYDGVLFHRIIKDFMVQTGGMGTNGQFKESTHPPIKNEARTSGCKNLEYTLSMARTTAPDSATNQFFVNTADNKGLDPGGGSPDGYAVFGVVVDGRAVVDAIENTPVEAWAPGKKCQQDSQPSCPKQEVVVLSAKVF